GWDYIGDQTWRDRVLRDVSGMVLRDRNHPSIIAWGTRLNETEDDVALYSKTRAIANELDGTRATTGAANSTVVAQGPVVPTPVPRPVRHHPAGAGRLRLQRLPGAPSRATAHPAGAAHRPALHGERSRGRADRGEGVPPHQPGAGAGGPGRAARRGPRQGHVHP